LTFEASIDGHLRPRGSAVSQENRRLEGRLTVGFWNLPIALISGAVSPFTPDAELANTSSGSSPVGPA
jgi:hypothetical protein